MNTRSSPLDLQVQQIAAEAFRKSVWPNLVLHGIKNAEAELPADFECVIANVAAENLFGQAHNLLTGKRLSEICSPTTFSDFLARFRYAMETGKAQYFECPGEAVAVGTVQWYEIVSVPVERGVSVTLYDITEKRLSEERLRKNYNQLVETRKNLRTLNGTLEVAVQQRTQALAESEERLRLVAQATNDAIYDWDFAQGSKWWSEGIFTQFGYPVAEVLEDASFWQNRLHPEERNLLLERIQQSINGGESQWSAEYRFLRANGSWAFVLDRATIRHDHNGVPYRMLGSMLDITDLREARRVADQRENEYYALAEAMPHIVWMAHTNGEIDYLNGLWFDYTGQPRKDFTGLESLRPYCHPADFDVSMAHWQQAFGQGTYFEDELRLRNGKTGEYRWFQVRSRATYDATGELVRWHGVFLDIHDRKTASEELERRVAERTIALQQVNEDLAHSNKELQQFAFVTSHDLKEPLRKILVFGKMLKERLDIQQVEKDRDLIGRIVHASQRMTALIDDLLSFSRISGPVPREAVDLNLVVSQIMNDLEVIISEKKAEVKCGLLPTLEAVPQEMQQLFQNLISNALKFSKEGIPPRVQLTAERVAQRKLDAPPAARGAYVRITVQDNGIGFDEVFSDKLFTLFQRLHTQAAYPGTGIGLAICKKIVEKHRGLIGARSTNSEGAVFSILLPLRAEIIA
jgi:two-component system CheB/CheR fusion protein